MSYTHDSAAGDITFDPDTNTSMPLLSPPATALDPETRATEEKSGRGRQINVPHLSENKGHHSVTSGMKTNLNVLDTFKIMEGIKPTLLVFFCFLILNVIKVTANNVGQFHANIDH